MRVLHLISSGGMYGAEAVILSLCEEMNGTLQDSSSLGVFAHQGQPLPLLHEVAVREGVPSAPLPCRGQLDLSVLKRIRDLAAQVRADVVHAHGYKADIYTYLAFRGKARPALVSTCHTWYDNDLAVKVYGAADRWVLHHFDQVVAVSVEVRDRLLRAGVPSGSVHIIRNGVNTDAFAGAAAARKSGAQRDGRLRVGLVGRLAPEKGVDVYLRAIARIAAECPDAHFVVAGDGPDRDALQSLLEDLHLAGRAELIGRQENMAAFYASLDVLVSASRQEGLPVALLEAMASGLSLVATKVGSIPELVRDGITGLLVPPADATALGEAMLRLLRDPGLRETMGDAGRSRVEEHFSAKRMTTDYLALYQAAVAGRAGRGNTAQESGA